jgi:hypothetical protein
MATRVTAVEVKQILDTDMVDTDIDVYITAANATVSAVLGTDPTLSDVQLKSIELFLTAHLIAATREPQISQAGAGGASVKYQGTTGTGLSGTMYGQQVLLLDPSGRLRAYLDNSRASMKAIRSFD